MIHLLAIHRSPRRNWVQDLSFGATDEVSMIQLDQNGLQGEALFSRLGIEGLPPIRSIKLDDQAKRAARTAREKYIRFVGEWPERYHRDGKNFKELLTFEGQLSLWWLSRARMKDSEGSPTFNVLFQLELLTLIISERRFHYLHLVSDDPVFRDLISQWGEVHDVAVSLYPKRVHVPII